MKTSSLKSWLLAFRLKTLTAAIVPIMVATSLCFCLKLLTDINLSLYALMSALCIQIATNLLNDAIDFKKGADTHQRQGPVRVTQSGLFTSKQVWIMGLIFLMLAVAFGIPLVIRGGLPIIILGLFSIFLAYGYTGGPFPLAYLGLGDLFVILFFGIFAVGGTCYLQSLSFKTPMLIAGMQVGFLSTVLIAINNLRDSNTDVLVGKKTLAVRFGDSFVKIEIIFLTVMTYLLSLYYLVFMSKTSVLISFLLMPLAVFIIGFIYSVKDKKHLNKALALAALHQLLFASLLSIGFIL
jgi:1,4-dihydroxy-2-naphthoate polyprenyltransferase